MIHLYSRSSHHYIQCFIPFTDLKATGLNPVELREYNDDELYNDDVYNCTMMMMMYNDDPFVFPQFTSLYSVFHSFHGLMNSINWPASSVWVFIAQLGEHCSANAEATGSNPVEAPKIFFFGLFSQLLKLRFTAMVIYSFHLYSRSSHHYIHWNIC